MLCSYYLSYLYCSRTLVLAQAVLLKKNNLKSILCSSLTTFVSSIRNIIMVTLLIWTIDLSNHCCCAYFQNYIFHPKCGSYACQSLKYYIAAQKIMKIKFLQLLFYQFNTIYEQLWCMSSVFLCLKMIIKDLGNSVICSIDH